VPKGLSVITSELNIPVRHNGLRQIVQFNDAIEKSLATLKTSEIREQGREWAILEK